MRISACLLAGFAGLSALLFAAPATQANITRHCDARYVWETTGGSLSGTFSRFNARGSCGRTVPNRCRARARDKIKRCVSDQWATRWERRTPESCGTSAGVLSYDTRAWCAELTGNDPHCFFNVDNDAVSTVKQIVADGDIKSRLEVAVCCQHENGFHNFANNADVRVRLRAISTGDKRCGATVTLSSDYGINCTAVRQNICQH